MIDTTTLFDSSSLISGIAIFGLLILSAFFSGSETALTAASRGKLQSHADRGSTGAKRALGITEDTEKLIGSILLGNNLVNILAASLATALFTKLFKESGIAVATVVMTVLVLVFSEVLPKTYAITNAEKAAAKVSAPIKFFILIFSPVVMLVRALVRGLLRIFGVKTDPNSQILSVQEEIAGALVLGHQEGVVGKEHRDRLLGALDLNQRSVEEIMLHRSEIETINAEDSPEDIISQCLESPHTRLPVFKGEPENIIGVLHAKDLLRTVEKSLKSKNSRENSLREFQVLEVVREPYFVPETTALDYQMRQFLKLHTHFALVVDEYGALQGLITLEDILEEIVGEITDEFDIEADQELKANTDGSYLVDGSTTIRDLNRMSDWALPDEEAHTVAGLLIHESQSIPEPGQVFSFHGFRFEVIQKSANRLTKIKVGPV
jgi:Mg2+/Co2+ transporter CorB